ncbi:hypothetical protein [Nonomuraea fuscirosea]|uniref:hypothetical protein n=1 Tax=Nonomuraea fuscirosea TaxID=1291556 RepID=UPI0011B1E90E|nr:hypothetical protein [Nonomuraea fuscirosea]
MEPLIRVVSLTGASGGRLLSLISGLSVLGERYGQWCRVRRAAWRLRQAEIEHEWAIASARAEGLPVRAAAEMGRSPSRIQQIATAAAPLPELEAALAQLRQAGWPTPEVPAGSDDEERDGRDSIADRSATAPRCR